MYLTKWGHNARRQAFPWTTDLSSGPKISGTRIKIFSLLFQITNCIWTYCQPNISTLKLLLHMYTHRAIVGHWQQYCAIGSPEMYLKSLKNKGTKTPEIYRMCCFKLCIGVAMSNFGFGIGTTLLYITYVE